jgi:hypothetical protein
MNAHQLDEHAHVPVLVPRHQQPSGTGGSSSASFVLALQRSAGNAAVARHLARLQRPAPHGPPLAPVRPSATLSVQRCGPVPCNCSEVQAAEHAANSRSLAGARLPTEEAAAGSLSVPTQPWPVRVQGMSAECEAESEHHVQRALELGPVLQRWPGDGMLPPGDCGWGTYVPLRVSVESAKAVVNMVGACAPGDSCPFLALKIAAITAEIVARVAFQSTCFKGGDTGHREQVQSKINMVNRCYRFFQASNCPQDLIAAMEVVVARARAVIEAAAAALAVAAVVAALAALIVAIIALVEVIVAAVAAAAATLAEAAVVAAAAAALGPLLTEIREYL